MARTCANAALDTISGRRRLAPRRAPYWRSIRLGLRVGWRRNAQDAAGTWLCRIALPGNDIRQKVLGGADDPPVRADGAGVLTYGQAVDAAQTWAGAVLAATGASAPAGANLTVLAALRAYQDAKKAAGQADRASATASLVKRHLPAGLAGTRCSELTEQVLRDWLRSRTEHARGGGAALSQGTRDKLRNVMGAALRAAGAPEAAIQSGLNAASAALAGAHRTAAGARHVILDEDQRGRLHAALATADPDLALLAWALDETGSRPVQLLGLTVADLDEAHCLLHVPASAKGKPGSARRPGVSTPITKGLVAALRAAALRDPAGRRLFTRPLREQQPGAFAAWTDTGRRTGWTKNAWNRSFAGAVHAAGLPADTTLYSLRHSRIVALIQANVPLRIIASMTDTSTAMIEKHYSRWIARTADAVAQVRRALRPESVEPKAA